MKIFFYKLIAYKIQPCFTPPKCTDVVAVIDDQIGKSLKDDMQKQLEESLVNSPEMFEEYINGTISMRKLRILSTTWLGNAWDTMKSKPEMIKNAFVRCGFCNDRTGRDNNKINIGPIKNFQLPDYDPNTEPMEPLTKAEQEKRATENMKEISEAIKESKKRKREEQKKKNLMRNKKKRKGRKQRRRKK